MTSDSDLIRAGRSANGRSLATPLWASAVWESSDFDDARQRAVRPRATEFYGRYSNPTVAAFEQAIAQLEGAEAALAFGSGMGAVASTVLALCSAGDHVVVSRQIYSGTLAFLQGPCHRFGIELTVVDGTQPGALAAAARPGTAMVIVETPSNPRLELIDLDEVGSIKGPFKVVDSTFATPIGQRPLDHGVDLVLHSATKGISGQNDSTLGVIAGDADLVDAVWGYSVLHGAAASPFDALNAIKGIRTLGVRTRQQSASALALAEALSQVDGVRAVHYPGLDTHPQHELAVRQMKLPGTVLAFELTGGVDAVKSMYERFSLTRLATSLGGPETLVCHPATTTHASLTSDEQAASGVTPGLVRVTVGLEDSDDIVADFTQAIK